jgi:hypothetical protein
MKEKVQHTLNGLKDFQLKTVDYVFHQLYKKGRSKMLIADEVGLGKTIVAKGILAKAYERFVPTLQKPVFKVVYICSNQALARQNLRKLNFTDDPAAIDYSDEDDRLTALAYDPPSEKNKLVFTIKAFTPATSFDDRTHAGKADERILLYRLLYAYSDLNPYSNSLKWILKGGRKMKDENWETRIQWAEDYDGGKINWLRKIRSKVYSQFRKSLEEEVSPTELPNCFAAAGITYKMKYWTLIRNLCQLGIRKNNYSNYYFSNELITSLRFKLSNCCVEFLQADIFILDEFQRYKKLIETSISEDDIEKLSPAIQLARDIFAMKNVKILMLSATPFKPYTNDFDELSGEVHHQEFITVLKFLLGNQTKDFWEAYEKDRSAFFQLLRHPDKIKTHFDEAIAIKNRLESLYRTGMTRTERQLASTNKSTMIESSQLPIEIRTEDIGDFVALDEITCYLNQHHQASLNIPLEYVKSCPYSLSFLDSYKHKEKLRQLVLDNPSLQRLLNKSKHAWLNLEDIKLYKPLIPVRGKSMPNAKFRLLLDQTVLNGGWKYLWIPPTIPYYEFSGAFKESEGYSKTLLFSSWKMVPRMVASLVSYESERLCVGDPNSVSEREKIEDKRFYFQKKRSPKPQFTFKVDKEEQEPQQMNNFSLTFPCLSLAKLYDPLSNVFYKKEFKKIRAELKSKLLRKLKQINLNQYATGKGDWKKWLWIAPLLLDKYGSDNNISKNWFEKGFPGSELSIDSEDMTGSKEENSGKGKHFVYAKEVFKRGDLINVGHLDKEMLDTLADHLVDMTLGSPAIGYLRTQLRYFEIQLPLLDAAFDVGSAFLTMLNKPESIAIIRLTTKEGDYWKRCMQYMIDGNIQSMFDEYVYLLRDCENLKTVEELNEFITDILSIRTVSIEVEGLKEFKENLTRDRPRRSYLRAHYAIDFGSQNVNTAKTSGRLVNIRQAFNSPFRPFVLATTSIGQEGLDFHFYCKKIFHWNLPSNPIDFEQREGRINRYKCLVIRQNLAYKYKQTISEELGDDLWSKIFVAAQQEKANSSFPCDLIPFWHTETVNGLSIQRFVPLYPFSRDRERYDQLIRVLSFYRLTFGQPRQDELIEALHSIGIEQEMKEELYKLVINLSPIAFMKERVQGKR